MFAIRLYNKRIWVASIVLVSVLLGYALSISPNFQSTEYSGMDTMFRWKARPSSEKAQEAVVVMIDESAYSKTYGYYDPLPRRYIAQLIDTLAVKGAKAIALDIAFFDKLDVLDAQGDSVLLRSMKEAGNVIAVSIYNPDDDGALQDQLPDPFFKSGLRGVGYANLEISGAGMLASARDVKPINTMGNGEMVLSFSSLAFCVMNDLPTDQFINDIQSQEWAYVPSIPLTEKGSMIINYVGPPATWIKQKDGSWTQNSEGNIITYRSSQLTTDISWPSDLLKDKIVFVGNGSEFVPDRFVTPYYELNKNNWMYGAEVHANAFLTLLHKQFIQRAGSLLIIGVLFIACASMVFATVRFGFTGELSVAIGLIIGGWVFAYLLFTSGVWFPVWSTTVSIVFAYFSTSIYQAFTEERNKKQIKTMFSRYAPPAYVDQLIKDPSKLELGGEEKEISILFSDIEGFTSISENLSPKQLVEVLNDYLNTMTHIIFDQGGNLDKYIGDAIVAVFGAPLPQNEHALHACYAALEMQKALIDFRAKLAEKKLPLIRSRIGINTGGVVVGNIGSDIRYDYTGIGDHMNLASRLEGANKQYGTFVMISEFTYEQVRERVIVRELDRIVVKGKSKPVKVFELIGRANEPLPESTRKMIEFYQQGMALYMKREWGEAIQKFEQALTSVHTDEPSKLYIQRAKSFMETPPPPDWDGSYHMTSK